MDSAKRRVTVRFWPLSAARLLCVHCSTGRKQWSPRMQLPGQ